MILKLSSLKILKVSVEEITNQESILSSELMTYDIENSIS
jgi:hypothetical protein